VTLGFRCEVDETCALLGYYSASGGNYLPTFRDNLSVPSSMGTFNTEDGNDGLFRNVGDKLPLLAA